MNKISYRSYSYDAVFLHTGMLPLAFEIEVEADELEAKLAELNADADLYNIEVAE